MKITKAVQTVAILLGALALFSSPSYARNITAETDYFRQITVKFSQKAKFCGLYDPEPLRELARTKLSAMDIPQNPEALTEVVIQVTAAAGGVLKQNCATHISLRLQVPFTTEFLDANAYQGEDQIFGILSQRIYQFPMTYYEKGIVFGDYPQQTPARALESLSALLDDLAVSRMTR